MPYTKQLGPDDQAAIRSSQAAATNPGGALTGTPNLYGTNAGFLNSQNAGQVATGVALAGALPTIAGSGLSMAGLLSEIGLSGPTSQLSADQLAQELAYSEAGLGINQEQNAISQQGNAAQLGLLNTQWGLENQEYGLQQQQYPEQQAQAALQHQLNVAGMQDQGAISGTLNTQGYGRQKSAEAQQYGWQQADISRAQQLAQLNQQGSAAQYQYNVGDLARAEQNLQLAAQQNGISYDQLQSQFAAGLNQIGIQGDPTQLYLQYLTQQSGQVGGLGQAVGEAGIVSPGQLASGAMAGGFNPTALFAGIG